MEQKMDIVVIGAMKAATSTICAYLEDHPDVYMVPKCEPNFFSHDDNFQRGETWYQTHLQAKTTEPKCGEGSNAYAARDMYPDAAARMAAYNPDMKIIYMVRHPIARIVSAWIQNRQDSGDQIPPTLDKAVTQMPEQFVGQSRYWHNLAPYRDLFGDGQIFIGFMEDLKRDPEGFLADLCAFLEITPKLQAERAHLNKSDGKRIPTETFTQIKRIPFARSLKRKLPKGFRTYVKQRFLTRDVSERPEFSPTVRARLTAELSPDAAALLAHCGKQADFWDLT